MILAGNGKKTVVGYFRKGRFSGHHCVTVQQGKGGGGEKKERKKKNPEKFNGLADYDFMIIFHVRLINRNYWTVGSKPDIS